MMLSNANVNQGSKELCPQTHRSTGGDVTPTLTTSTTVRQSSYYCDYSKYCQSLGLFKLAVRSYTHCESDTFSFLQFFKELVKHKLFLWNTVKKEENQLCHNLVQETKTKQSASHSLTQ